MKFICNNCNFSAKVPKKITNCPMCGSSDTSVYEDDEEIVSQPIEPTEPKSETSVEKEETVTEPLSSKSSNVESSEKEFFLEETDAKSKSSFPLPLISIAVVVLAGVIVVFYFMRDSDKVAFEQTDVVAEEMAETAEVKEDSKKADIVQDNRDENVLQEKVNKDEIVKENKEVLVEKKVAEKAVKKETHSQKHKPKKVVPARKAKLALKANLKPVKIKNNIKLKIPSASEYIEKGNKAISSGNYLAAKSFFKKALQRDKKAAKAYRGLGIAYSQLNQPSASCANYRKYLKYDPTTPEKAQLEQMLIEYCR